MIVGIHMHFHDDEQPDEWVRTLMDALAPGSYLFITDFVDTGEPLQKAIEQAGLESLGNGWIRTPERIEQHFLGLPLVPPGLDFLARWFPEDPEADVSGPRGPAAVPADPDGRDREEGLTASATTLTASATTRRASHSGTRASRMVSAGCRVVSWSGRRGPRRCR